MHVRYYVFLSDESLSRNYIKIEIDYQQYFNQITCAQYSHGAWFLDGRTSILAIKIALIC